MSFKEWKVIDTGISSAEQNMAFDQDLLETLAFHQEGPILHLYEWAGPSATFGHFIDPYTLLQSEGIREFGLQLARRPTGGGLIFHLTDLAFSVLVPASHPGYSLNVLENYSFVNKIVIEIVKCFRQKNIEPTLLPKELGGCKNGPCHFCMAKPTKYDVMLEGRKVAGGAQRRTRYGFLHQGSISLALPDEEFLEKILLPESRILEEMRTYTYSLLSKPTHQEVIEAKHIIRDLLLNVIRDY